MKIHRHQRAQRPQRPQRPSHGPTRKALSRDGHGIHGGEKDQDGGKGSPVKRWQFKGASP
jgi:hypothetical protein